MKALITIIALALVAWGAWAFFDNDPEPVDGQEANVSDSFDSFFGDDSNSTSTDDAEDDSGADMEDKG